MTSLSKKSGYLVAMALSTVLLWNTVSYKTIFACVSVAGVLLITLPLFLLHSKKLPQFSEEKVRRFVDRVGVGPIGHRGGKPENTLAALRRAKSLGAGGVELDLALTADGHAVFLRGAAVDRASNGSGQIEGMTLSEAKQLDFGAHCGAEFAGERIPTLKETIALCKELDLVAFVEVKSSTTGIDRVVQVMTELFSENPDLYEQVAVISFFPTILYKLRSADLNIICGLNFVTDYIILAPDGIYEGKEWWKYVLSPLADQLMLWSLETWLLPLLGVKLVLPYKDLILKERVSLKSFEEKGFSVIPWTVNKREEVELCKEVLRVPYVTDVLSDDDEAMAAMKLPLLN